MGNNNDHMDTFVKITLKAWKSGFMSLKICPYSSAFCSIMDLPPPPTPGSLPIGILLRQDDGLFLSVHLQIVVNRIWRFKRFVSPGRGDPSVSGRPERVDREPMGHRAIGPRIKLTTIWRRSFNPTCFTEPVVLGLNSRKILKCLFFSKKDSVFIAKIYNQIHIWGIWTPTQTLWLNQQISTVKLLIS